MLVGGLTTVQHIPTHCRDSLGEGLGDSHCFSSENRTMPSQDREIVGARVEFCISDKNPSSSRILETSLQKRERLGESPTRDINRPSRQ